MRLVRLLAGLALILGSFAVATPVSAGDPCYHGFDAPDRSESGEPRVRMLPCAFAPTIVRVAPGTTVTWSNDQFPHLLTGANQEWGSRDDEVAAGASVAFRFDRPGTYPYACAIHRGMSGTVIVGDGVTHAAADAAAAVVQIKGAASPPPASQAAAAPAATATAKAPAAAIVVSTTRSATDVAPSASIVALAIAVAAIGLAVVGFVASRRRPAITATRD